MVGGDAVMKWLGIAMVFTACTVYGFLIDLNQKKRVKELDEFAKAFEILKGEIAYRLTPVAEALRYVAPLVGQGVGEVLVDLSEQLEEKHATEVSEMWQGALKKHKATFHLLEGDYKSLYEFGDMIGNMDKNMQTNSLGRITERIKKEQLSAKEKYDRTTMMNKYLGILMGICISIFLI